MRLSPFLFVSLFSDPITVWHSLLYYCFWHAVNAYHKVPFLIGIRISWMAQESISIKSFEREEKKTLKYLFLELLWGGVRWSSASPSKAGVWGLSCFAVIYCRPANFGRDSQIDNISRLLCFLLPSAKGPRLFTPHPLPLADDFAPLFF